MRQRELKKYSSLYKPHQMNVITVTSTIRELTTPKLFSRRGKDLATQLLQRNQPLIIHTFSGGFWMMISMLEHMDKEWREENVKTIVLDSCPIMSNVEAIQGFLDHILKRK